MSTRSKIKFKLYKSLSLPGKYVTQVISNGRSTFVYFDSFIEAFRDLQKCLGIEINGQ